MDVESSNGCKERDSFFSPAVRVFQAIVMQDTVVDTLGGCAFVHFKPKTLGTPGYPGEEAQVIFQFRVDDSAIV